MDMSLIRMKARWAIPGAGTAWSVFHFTTVSGSSPTQPDIQAAYAKVSSFFNDLKVALPAQVTITPATDVEEIVEGNGQLIGVWSATSSPAITGTAAAATGWSAPTGGVVSWITGGVRNGRRVKGRTFVVPLSTGAYDTDGTLRPGEFNVINAAAGTLRTPTAQVGLAVYARPTSPGATDGQAFTVASHRVPDMCAILRSRRS